MDEGRLQRRIRSFGDRRPQEARRVRLYVGRSHGAERIPGIRGSGAIRGAAKSDDAD